ncbi:putative guanosine-diphosphatase [Yarrowia sp. B02]|nr:putative guanosine-diphosphatase [Yarrowia sp. B02]
MWVPSIILLLLTWILRPIYTPNSSYAVVVDAGSTGSRVHVFKFRHETNQSLPVLEDKYFEFTRPGLSSFASEPQQGAETLRGMLNRATSWIPSKHQSETPVWVKCTAGLRMLAPEEQEGILTSVDNLLDEYPFQKSPEAVAVLNGEEEGFFAWMTLNYLLGRLQHNRTVSVAELGGGSTQIVFEMERNKGGCSSMAVGDDERKFDLYQYSHLGYGLMEARKKIFELNNGRVNPCIGKGMSKVINGKTEAGYELTSDALNDQECIAYMEVILHTEPCTHSSCSLNNVYQPPIDTYNGDLYLISYFYDRTSNLGLQNEFTLRDVKKLQEKVCHGQWTDISGLSEMAFKELQGRPEWCLDLSFMYTLLHSGYGIALDRPLKTVKSHGGNEVSWALGVALQNAAGY